MEAPAGLQDWSVDRAVIGRDFFLGVWTDALGVESVRLYRLERGGRP